MSRRNANSRGTACKHFPSIYPKPCLCSELTQSITGNSHPLVQRLIQSGRPVRILWRHSDFFQDLRRAHRPGFELLTHSRSALAAYRATSIAVRRSPRLTRPPNVHCAFCSPFSHSPTPIFLVHASSTRRQNRLLTFFHLFNFSSRQHVRCQAARSAGDQGQLCHGLLEKLLSCEYSTQGTVLFASLTRSSCRLISTVQPPRSSSPSLKRTSKMERPTRLSSESAVTTALVKVYSLTFVSFQAGPTRRRIRHPELHRSGVRTTNRSASLYQRGMSSASGEILSITDTDLVVTGIHRR